MLIEFIKNSKFVHFFTNSFLLKNSIKNKGKSNKISGLLAPLRIKSKIRIYGGNNKIDFSLAIHNKFELYIEGDNNKVHIGKVTKLNNTLIYIIGSNCEIFIDDGVQINNAEFGLERKNSEIILNKYAKIGGFVWLKNKANHTERAKIYSLDGKTITVGEYTCVSDGVVVRNSDSHVIAAESGEIINEPEDVKIGGNCWICSGALLLKGSGVGDNSVVGARSFLNRDYSDRKNVIIAGSPAKIVRENITWHL